MANNPQYITISALSNYIKAKFDNDPNLNTPVHITGEISNFRERPGHQYFSLKDDNATINVVCFASQYRNIKFTPQNGMKVYATGRVSTYPKNGAYQYYLSNMEPAGVGALYQALTELKTKLNQAGYFDEAHKKAIPKYPTKIAVITSPSGAVIKDIIKTGHLRNPNVQIDLYPAVVQGDEAAKTIINQLTRIQNCDYDTVIIGRGGGSIEDLWPFNNEALADIIYHYPIPIISSVGHQTDYTIADYVADMRAATPTAAAELSIPDRNHLLYQIDQLQVQLQSDLQNKVTNLAQHLNNLINNNVFANPQKTIEPHQQKAESLITQLKLAIQQNLEKYQQHYNMSYLQLEQANPKTNLKLQQVRYHGLYQKLTDSMQRTLQHVMQSQTDLQYQLQNLNPMNITKKGYIYATKNHEIVKAGQTLAPHTTLDLHFNDATVTVTIDAITPTQ